MAAQRRTREDWTEIALAALAEGGLAAVAVEPLAARVGATKGSVYWHFATRDALVQATLERWEREHTEAVIDLAEAGETPADRLRILFGAVLHPEQGVEVELALLASLNDPLVAAAVARAGERRVDYLATQFAQYGFGRAQARRRAVIAYSVYLGQAQLTRGAPETLPRSPAARRAHVAEVLRLLLTESADS
ncbi:TetR/AcrR family transcriptional regulator [Actinokineospora iranica]|uniref:DNA-binding transcriptional regulator, AcrR family n=1 Tax=Actinokineospora iranica TaxID=1271860 RepID=A0A1G6KFG0_9PSEU|nr:TetR/AcrR family transcriptional regulator [Actinokineospora iranica]SDC29315.1 DNA-binding transcriptional regulator, AcrR family [Actinokineospora iranica]